MNHRLTQIGFSQRVRLEWLEKTTNLILAGNDGTTIYNILQRLLEDKLSVGGHAKRGNREKVITILMKIWVRPPHDLHPLWQEGLKFLSHIPHKKHIAVHWGMTMAVYPFWGFVAEHVGRLLRLQGTITHAQVRRRIMEQYGQRPTVKDAVRRVLRSMVDWGVLNDTKEKGVYVQGNKYSIKDPNLITWLLEAYLHTRVNGSAAVNILLDNPSLFPFSLTHITGDLMASISPRLNILRHGLDDDLLMLQ